jgi:WD40 repeat protein
MNKYLVTMALALGIASSQATRLHIAFEGADNAPVRYEREFVAAQPVTADLPYDHVRLTFVDDNSEVVHVVSRRVIQELAPVIGEYFDPGIAMDPSFFDLEDSKIQRMFPGLNAQSFGLIMRMYDEARDASCRFTQESLDTFVRAVVKEGLDAKSPVLDCTTPLTLALKLAVVASGLYAPVANELMELATTDDYVRMSTPADLELVKNFKQGLYGKHPIWSMYNRVLIPFWTEQKVFATNGSFVSIMYAPDNEHIAGASPSHRSACICNLTNGTIVKTEYDEQDLPCVQSVAYSPDGRYIARVNGDRAIRICNAKTGKLEDSLVADTVLDVVAYSPDGSHIAARGETATYIWNLSNGTLEHRLVAVSDHYRSSLVYSPDGGHLALGGKGHIAIWDTKTGALEKTIGDGVDSDLSFAYSPDGSCIATVCFNGVNIWDVTTGTVKQQLVAPVRWPSSVQYSPDGAYVLVVTLRRIHIWNVVTGKVVLVVSSFPENKLLIMAAYSPLGDQFAVPVENELHIYSAGTEFSNLNVSEQWHMLVRNAKVPFKTRADALAAVREIKAAGETLTVDDKDCLKRGEIKEAVKFEPCVDQGMQELLERNAPWQDVKEYLRAHNTMLDTQLITRARQYIEERCTGASSSQASGPSSNL